MDGFGFPLFVFIAWIIFGVIRGAAKAAGELQRKPGGAGRPLPKSLPGMSPDFLEMLQKLERARRPEPTPPRRLPTAAGAGAPELDEEARSLEGDVRRPVREEISLDSASAAAIKRRREAAARRDLPRTAADHAAFDARIRIEPDRTAVAPPPATARLRHALIWNEILGRPVSLRDEPEPRSR